MRTAWKFLLVFTVGLITHDAFQDALGACSFDLPGAAVCHSCVCGPHLATDMGVAAPLPTRAQTFAPYEASLSPRLLPKAMFHPPNASA